MCANTIPRPPPPFFSRKGIFLLYSRYIIESRFHPAGGKAWVLAGDCARHQDRLVTAGTRAGIRS